MSEPYQHRLQDADKELVCTWCGERPGSRRDAYLDRLAEAVERRAQRDQLAEAS